MIKKDTLRPWASKKQLVIWIGFSVVIALSLLFLTWIFSLLYEGNPLFGEYNILSGVHPNNKEDIAYVLKRNFLVLGIHFGACLIAIIIGRNVYEKEKRLEDNPDKTFHWNDLPQWVISGSLIYAWVVTLSSIIFQAEASGEIVSHLAAFYDTNTAYLLLFMMTHALIELTAIFLPLALFLKEARVNNLHKMGKWSLQVLLVAIPILLAASFIEVYITPDVLSFMFDNDFSLALKELNK